MEKFEQDNDFSENYKQDSSLVELSQSKICGEGVLQSNSTVYLENGNQPETKTDTLISNQEELEVVQPLKSKDTFCGGLLLVWGCGEFGQHGHGHTEDVLSGDALGSPLWLGQERMVVEVACGSSHTLVLTDDNKIYSWGNSNSGQLGMGNTETSPHPRPLHLGVSSGTKLAGVTCGTRHSIIWTQDGDCFSFGNNYSGQLGYDFRKPDYKENQLRPVFVDTLLHRQVSQVSCGARHSVFLFTNGQVAAVGVNNRGQIGCGDTVDVVCAKTVSELPPISVIACGNSHTLAADVHGCVYAWGYGKACGSKTDILSPSCVFSSSEEDNVLDMAGGDSHSLILLSSSTVYSWGNNFEGQLGHGRSVRFLSEPKELSYNLLPGKVVSISVGENTCAAVTVEGELYMWGKNSSLVIRDDENSRFFQFEPRLVPLGVWKALKVSCGSWHVACVVFASPKGERNEAHEEKPQTVAITTDGEVDTDSVCSQTIVRDEKEIELNRDSKAVVSEPSAGVYVTPGLTSIDHYEPRTQDEVICNGNEVRQELIEDVVTNEAITSEKQIREQECNSINNDLNNEAADNKKVESGFEGTENTTPSGRHADSNLEEKPALIRISKESVRRSSVVINEEKPAVIANVRKNPDNTETKDDEECSSTLNISALSRAEGQSCLTRDDGSKRATYSSLPEFISTRPPSITEAQEETSTTSTKNLEMEQTTAEPTRNKDCLPKETDEFDALVAAFNRKAESEETTCEEEKEYVEQKGNACPVTGTRAFSERYNSSGSLHGLENSSPMTITRMFSEKRNGTSSPHESGSASPITRTRAFSEQYNSPGSPHGSRDISVALHSGSLDNLRLYHQQEGANRGARLGLVAYSPPSYPRSSGGHLNREKRPARMLRRTSFEEEYHLPNQPVHTVDIGLSTYVRRPHPPMNRTQSSPSLYSSNLIKSPLGGRKKSSVSAKVPRPPTDSTTNDAGLPPRPPARGNRRPLEFNPVFSSGSSWRKRK